MHRNAAPPPCCILATAAPCPVPACQSLIREGGIAGAVNQSLKQG
jgi:hypothetical protein